MPIDLRDDGDEEVLVVDDDQIQVILMTDILSDLGIKSAIAHNGKEALKIVFERA